MAEIEYGGIKVGGSLKVSPTGLKEVITIQRNGNIVRVPYSNRPVITNNLKWLLDIRPFSAKTVMYQC